MKTKVIQENSYARWEARMNDFEAINKVRATQTHVTNTPEGLIYTSVMYFEE